MVTLAGMGITKEDLHSEHYLKLSRNQLLVDITKTIGDKDLLLKARELKYVLIELEKIRKENNKNVLEEEK